MSLPTNLILLTPPTFPPGYCPPSWQQFSSDLIGGTTVTLLVQSGTFIYNYGSTTPLPENRIYPWLNTNTGLWYTFQLGMWTAPRPIREQDPEYNWIWAPVAGTPESALWTKDGGDGTDPSIPGNVTAVTGSFWKVNHVIDGRTIIGAGAIPGSNPAITLSVGQTIGEAQHKLLLTEMESHSHPLTGNMSDPTNREQQVVVPAPGENPGFADFTVQTGLAGGDPASTPPNQTVAHNNIQPSLGVYLVSPTARKFYVLPP